MHISCTVFEMSLERIDKSGVYNGPELHVGPNFKIRPDAAHENRDPTRPANIPGFLDPTRPDDYP